MLLAILFIGAIVSAFLATTKDRSPIGWFFIGGFFPLLSVILLLVLPAVPPPVQPSITATHS